MKHLPRESSGDSGLHTDTGLASGPISVEDKQAPEVCADGNSSITSPLDQPISDSADEESPKALQSWTRYAFWISGLLFLMLLFSPFVLPAPSLKAHFSGTHPPGSYALVIEVHSYVPLYTVVAGSVLAELEFEDGTTTSVDVFWSGRKWYDTLSQYRNLAATLIPIPRNMTHTFMTKTISHPFGTVPVRKITLTTPLELHSISEPWWLYTPALLLNTKFHTGSFPVASVNTKSLLVETVITTGVLVH